VIEEVQLNHLPRHVLHACYTQINNAVARGEVWHVREMAWQWARVVRAVEQRPEYAKPLLDWLASAEARAQYRRDHPAASRGVRAVSWIAHQLQRRHWYRV
jgi:hypothetical protein